MKKLIILLLPLLFGVLSAEKCQEEMIKEEWLTQEWLITDRAGDTLIYRPKGYDLPPRRWRTAIQFKKGGEFVDYSFGPTDRPITTKGAWEHLAGTPKIKITFNSKAELKDFTYQVVTLQEDLLKVKKL